MAKAVEVVSKWRGAPINLNHTDFTMVEDVVPYLQDFLSPAIPSLIELQVSSRRRVGRAYHSKKSCLSRLTLPIGPRLLHDYFTQWRQSLTYDAIPRCVVTMVICAMTSGPQNTSRRWRPIQLSHRMVHSLMIRSAGESLSSRLLSLTPPLRHP